MSSSELQIEQHLAQITADGVEVDATIIESAKTGDGEALYKIGEIYYKVPNYAKAMIWYQESSKKNNPNAQNGLGYLHQHGQGVDPDYKVAMEWYIKSSNQGNTEAMYNIGELHYNGQGVSIDKQQAIHWYQKSADGGLEKGKLAVTKLNEEGVHVDNTQQVIAEMQKTIEQLKIQNQEKDKAYDEHIKSLEGKITQLSGATPSPSVVVNTAAPAATPAPAAAPAAKKPEDSGFGGFAKLMKGFEKVVTKLSSDDKSAAPKAPASAPVQAPTPNQVAQGSTVAAAANNTQNIATNQLAQSNTAAATNVGAQDVEAKSVQNDQMKAEALARGQENNEVNVEEEEEEENEEEDEEEEEDDEEEENEEEEEEEDEDEDEEEEEEEEEDDYDDDDDY